MSDDDEPTDPELAAWQDDEPTIAAEFATPETMPRCIECGRVVFTDDWTPAASFVAEGLFSPDRCVRAKDGHWSWCGNFSPTHGRLVYLVPHRR